MDDEIIDHFVHLMRDRGMQLRLSSEIGQIRFAPNGSPVCVLKDGRQVSSELVLYTAGRVAATAELGLEPAVLPLILAGA